MAYTHKQFCAALLRAFAVIAAIAAFTVFFVHAMDEEAVIDCQKLAKLHQGKSLVESCLRK